MINKIFYILILSPLFVFSQKTELNKQFGIEASILSIGGFYEQPFTENILGEFSAGYGNAFIKDYSRFGFDFSNYMPYSRITLKAFYNRKRRLRNGKNISHNWGNYIGIQNKIIYNVKKYYYPYMINEIHWGVQTELNNNLLLNFHLGVGYGLSTKNKNNGFILPTIGLRLKYTL